MMDREEFSAKMSRMTAISPLDGRYQALTRSLSASFSDLAYNKYRLFVEIKWFEYFLAKILNLPLQPEEERFLTSLHEEFSPTDYSEVKLLEAETKHDLKAIEYCLRKKVSDFGGLLADNNQFIHFGCTSEDINNLAIALMAKNGVTILTEQLKKLLSTLGSLASNWANIPMLARTHGQLASPTTFGKEVFNFYSRLTRQMEQLSEQEFLGKFNGAVGNYNAHVLAYPNLDWIKISTEFVSSLSLKVNLITAQIEPHDFLAELFHKLLRINNILLDLSKDFWTYISLNYLKLKVNPKEVGSSTMPHKVNPIKFENSEGNLGLSNAILDYMSNKLPISRMQRDLSDSTVLRNIGSGFAYALIAYTYLNEALAEVSPNLKHAEEELLQHWEILGEALQTLSRKNKLENSYEILKEFTRGKEKLSEAEFHQLLAEVKITSTEDLAKLKTLSPDNYLGLAKVLVQKLNNPDNKIKS